MQNNDSKQWTIVLQILIRFPNGQRLELLSHRKYQSNIQIHWLPGHTWYRKLPANIELPRKVDGYEQLKWLSKVQAFIQVLLCSWRCFHDSMVMMIVIYRSLRLIKEVYCNQTCTNMWDAYTSLTFQQWIKLASQCLNLARKWHCHGSRLIKKWHAMLVKVYIPIDLLWRDRDYVEI